jgi:capsule polysaccharide export protein KpsC/LpsZ
MPTAHFPSLEDSEMVEVEFMTLSGEVRTRKLLVDSGFTGQSSIVLREDDTGLIWAKMDPMPTSGALQGDQDRAWVSWRVHELGIQMKSIAILTNLDPLSLPHGIRGMAGLTFLRHFTRWGAERSAAGWRFSLTVDRE